MHKPVNTRDTVVRVHGVSWCAKNLDHTWTCSTCFESTMGLTVPVLNASFRILFVMETILELSEQTRNVWPFALPFKRKFNPIARCKLSSTATASAQPIS